MCMGSTFRAMGCWFWWQFCLILTNFGIIFFANFLVLEKYIGCKPLWPIIICQVKPKLNILRVISSQISHWAKKIVRGDRWTCKPISQRLPLPCDWYFMHFLCSLFARGWERTMDLYFLFFYYYSHSSAESQRLPFYRLTLVLVKYTSLIIYLDLAQIYQAILY